MSAVAEDPPQPLTAAARGFVFDMDGTLVLGDRRNRGLAPLPGALEMTRHLDALGVPYAVVTNGTTRTPRSHAAVARDPGVAVADDPTLTADVLGRLRSELGERLGLADPDVLAYVWVNRFPMYQWDAENGRWDATHNPFSGVVPEDEGRLVTTSGDPARPSGPRPVPGTGRGPPGHGAPPHQPADPPLGARRRAPVAGGQRRRPPRRPPRRAAADRLTSGRRVRDVSDAPGAP